MTTIPSDILRDQRGLPMFHCSLCSRPLAAADVFDHGLRLPDYGESPEDFFEAELLDNLNHLACMPARQPGRSA